MPYFHDLPIIGGGGGRDLRTKKSNKHRTSVLVLENVVKDGQNPKFLKNRFLSDVF